jgi:hypothetical protein
MLEIGRGVERGLLLVRAGALRTWLGCSLIVLHSRFDR